MHLRAGETGKAKISVRCSRLKKRDAVRALVREWIHQHGIDHAEDRDRRANPESERENGGEGKARMVSQLAERVADVLQNGGQENLLIRSKKAFSERPIRTSMPS